MPQESDGVAGPVVRIAPNEYSIDDPAAAKIIYGSGRAFVKVSIANTVIYALSSSGNYVPRIN